MKSIRLIVMAALAATSLAVPTAPAGAQDQGANAELLQFCYGLMDIYGPILNLGECMSFNLTPDPGFKTKLCDFFLETGQLADAGFESYSDCVRNAES